MKNSRRTAISMALCASLLTLAACNSEPDSSNMSADDPTAEELANAAPPPAVPMIKASHTYRCKDNSLIFVDFMTDDKTANFRSAKDAPVVHLAAPEAGEPFVSADGATTITGSGDEISYNGQACKTG